MGNFVDAAGRGLIVAQYCPTPPPIGGRKLFQRMEDVMKPFLFLCSLVVLAMTAPAWAQHMARHLEGTVTNTNSTMWSGYVVGGATGSVSDVKGSWTVPTAKCNLFTVSKSSFWVGIDGATSPGTVEQIGTHSNCNSFEPSYDAWYEFYPNGQIVIPNFQIFAGDEVSAEVSYDSGTELFTVSITDETTGHSFSISQGVPSAPRSTAEWIAEDPEYKIGKTFYPWPLTDFGTAGYGSGNTNISGTCYATVGSRTGPIGSFATPPTSLSRYVLSNNGNAAVPSPLSADGSSFSVTWEGGAVLLDIFTQDNALNAKLWTTSSAFLDALAIASSSPPGSFVMPELKFDPLFPGMQMTGIVQDFRLTGVQSISTFSPPFTVTAYVAPVRGTANPFEIFLASADLTQFITLAANVNPVYYGFWAGAPNVGPLADLGEQFSPPISPQFNAVYKIVLTVDATGAGTASVEDSSGALLGSLSGLEPGTGPFYLVLGQRIGLAQTGLQAADWYYVGVTTP
jgi:hypothetical protein